MNSIDLTPLTDIMAMLRDPENGCPWDLKQSHETLVSMTFEEVAELADAIAKSDNNNICEELGDLLFHLVFYARIAEEAGDFTMQDVIDYVAEKMIRRHPHIFQNTVYASEAEQKADWERIKAEEKALKPNTYEHLSILEKMDSLPAMLQSISMQKQLSNMGFDWQAAADVFAKINEEINELNTEMQADNPITINEEFGDLLFAVINLGRKLNVDPETALRSANHKFYARSEQMIQRAGNIAKFTALSQCEKSTLWEQVKCQNL